MDGDPWTGIDFWVWSRSAIGVPMRVRRPEDPVNEHAMSPSRRPIVIADSQLSAGRASASLRADDPEALLRDYLRLIRRVRNQQRARNIALRRVDIEALARHLDWTDDEVLARLADLMGATRRQRATMLAVLSTGAAFITVASPMSAAASGADATALTRTEPPIVIDGESITSTAFDNIGAGVGRPIARVDVGDPSMPRGAPVLEQQTDRTSATQATAEHEQPKADVDETASEPARGPDGATVAVGQPPVPPAPPDTGTDTDGNTVAVGQPPVPPAPPDPSEVEAALPDSVVPAAPATGVDTDGNTVAVGQPPVPAAPPATGVDADGNTVAVGQPPVPPTPDT